jgi:hypothetical protein
VYKEWNWREKALDPNIRLMKQITIQGVLDPRIYGCVALGIFGDTKSNLFYLIGPLTKSWMTGWSLFHQRSSVVTFLLTSVVKPYPKDMISDFLNKCHIGFSWISDVGWEGFHSGVPFPPFAILSTCTKFDFS